MAQIYSLPDDQIVPVTPKDRVLLASICYGIPYTSVCGGNARCSTCRVRVLEGLEFCQPRTEAELKLARKLGLPQDIRLACQLRGNGDVTLRRLVIDHLDIDLVASQMSTEAQGQEKLLAILFADIRGFTTRSETMLPYDVIYLLNCYFERIGKVIVQNGGMINTYMGDGLMALFGTKNDSRLTHGAIAEQAVQAGLAMLEEVAVLNQHIDLLQDRPLKIGIGIHMGNVVLGKIGARPNQVITAIGDAVNFASRIESTNKLTGTELLISQDVYASLQERVGDRLVVGSEHRLNISGKQGEYHLYEVMAITPTAEPEHSPSIWQNLWAQLNRPLF